LEKFESGSSGEVLLEFEAVGELEGCAAAFPVSVRVSVVELGAAVADGAATREGTIPQSERKRIMAKMDIVFFMDKMIAKNILSDNPEMKKAVFFDKHRLF